jgi:hypothetical protein
MGLVNQSSPELMVYEFATSDGRKSCGACQNHITFRPDRIGCLQVKVISCRRRRRSLCRPNAAVGIDLDRHREDARQDPAAVRCAHRQKCGYDAAKAGDAALSAIMPARSNRSWPRPFRWPKRLMLCVTWLRAAPSGESSSQSDGRGLTDRTRACFTSCARPPVSAAADALSLLSAL